MRIFFSVGEPSGDLHASNLIQNLHRLEPNLQCVGFGGPKMKAAGCELLFDLTQLAVMFLTAALRNLRKFFRLIADADRYFSENQVDAVVLIDFSGFNWWIAKKAKRHNIPVFYYGVPQMWAWGPWRIRKLRRLVDHVLCKLPFEVDWFAKRGCQATYVGHPYFDQLETQTYDKAFTQQLAESKGESPLLVLLPGSRNMEVDRNLKMMIDTATRLQSTHPDLRVAVACYNERHLQIANQLADEAPASIQCYAERTPELMKSADVCLACSGSVSLELLYHRKPTVIVYKLSYLFMALQMMLLQCKFITLTNLIAVEDIRRRRWGTYNPDLPGAESVPMPEYLTTRDCPERLTTHLDRWLNDPQLYQAQVQRLDQLAKQYAKSGATKRAAEYIFAQIIQTESEGSVRAAA